MAVMEGGCLCGAVRFRGDGEPKLVFACHCTACQRNTGSAFSFNIGVDEGTVTVEGDALRTYEDRSGASGQVFERAFCGRCGSPIFGRGAAYPGLVFFKVGTLDDPAPMRPAAHIWCQDKQPWFAIPEDAQRVEGSPV